MTDSDDSKPSTEQVSVAALQYHCYGDAADPEAVYLPAIRQLISKDLSEPYSIYVYRYFLHDWARLCFMSVAPNGTVVGAILCKLEPHRGGPLRGYIAMLVTRIEYRGRGIATELVKMAVKKMKAEGADEIALETEVDNIASLRIYENLGFLRTKRLHRYYLSGKTAFRLILYLKPGVPYMQMGMPAQDQVHEQAEDIATSNRLVEEVARLRIDEESTI